MFFRQHIQKHQRRTSFGWQCTRRIALFETFSTIRRYITIGTWTFKHVLNVARGWSIKNKDTRTWWCVVIKITRGSHTKIFSDKTYVNDSPWLHSVEQQPFNNDIKITNFEITLLWQNHTSIECITLHYISICIFSFLLLSIHSKHTPLAVQTFKVQKIKQGFKIPLLYRARTPHDGTAQVFQGWLD